MALYGQESCQCSQQLQVRDAVDIDSSAEGRARRGKCSSMGPKISASEQGSSSHPEKGSDAEHKKTQDITVRVVAAITKCILRTPCGEYLHHCNAVSGV